MEAVQVQNYRYRQKVRPLGAGVLELFSSDYVIPHYYWLAGTLGFGRYTAASGGGFDINKNYRMDPGVLRKKLEFLQAR